MITSSSVDDFSRQAAAYSALTKLLEDARACRSLFEEAGIAMPDILGRFFAGPHGAAPKVVVPRMQSPAKPTGWKESWIWLPLKDATVVTVVRCVLQAAIRPLGPSEIFAEVKKHRPETSSGTVSNIGTRLEEGGFIQRSNGEWRATDQSRPPVMHAGHAWGPPEELESYDIAFHRRMAVEHVLRAHSDGMQPMQLLKALESCEWLKVAVNKDLLKLDLETLDHDRRIHRRGNTGKWTVLEATV